MQILQSPLGKRRTLHRSFVPITHIRCAFVVLAPAVDIEVEVSPNRPNLFAAFPGKRNAQHDAYDACDETK